MAAITQAATTGNWSSTGTWTGAVVPCKPYTITGCANNGSGLIRVTIGSAASEYATSDKVNIIGVLGTTEANGNWTITVVNSTTFDLQGSTFSHAYTSGGTAFRGDTVTLDGDHVITWDSGAFDANGILIVGSDPGTGGTAAITFKNNVGTPTTGAAYSFPADKTLRLRGDIACDGSFPTLTWTFASGSQLILDPKSGATYKIDMSATGYGMRFVFDGSSGAHCVLKTDTGRGGSAGYMNSAGGSNRDMGLITATWLDISDMGSTTQVGVITELNNTGTAFNISITDTTFTTAAYSFLSNSSWDGNFTFQRARFASGSGYTLAGQPTCAQFNFGGNRTSGTRLVDACVFDLLVQGTNRQCKFTNTIFRRVHAWGSGSSWPDNTYYSGNILYFNDTNDTSGGGAPLYGPAKDSYVYDLVTTNPHMTAVTLDGLTSPTFDGMIFDGAATSAVGECLFIAATSGAAVSVTVRRCLVLPTFASGGATGISPGKLFEQIGASTTSVFTIEHNTQCGNGENGMVTIGESSGAPVAGELLSVRANLLADLSGAATANYLVCNDPTSTSTTNAVATTPGAGYNGFLNRTTPTGTDRCNLNSVATSTPGYARLNCSVAAPFPTTQLGTGDVTISGNPFVDATRCLGSWGQTVHGVSAGSDNGVSEALDWLVGDGVTNLAANIAAMLAWVRAGFRLTDTALRGASYSGDSLTTDAAGNSWAGATPDIGAMAFVATGGVWPFFVDQSHSGGFWDGGY